MDELIKQIAANTGLDAGLVHRSVAIVLKFLTQHGPEEKVRALIDALPGASEAIANEPEIGGGVMGVFGSLTSAGLGMGDIQGVTQEFIALAKSTAGQDTIDEIVGSIPGLNQFV